MDDINNDFVTTKSTVNIQYLGLALKNNKKSLIIANKIVNRHEYVHDLYLRFTKFDFASKLKFRVDFGFA